MRLLAVTDSLIFSNNEDHYVYPSIANELLAIEENFEEIHLIGYAGFNKHYSDMNKRILNRKFRFTKLKFSGRKKIWQKIVYLYYGPLLMRIILKEIKKSDIIHLRGPSFPALLACILSFFVKNKVWWIKYAGDWKSNDIPLGFRIQRFLFKQARHATITINGFDKRDHVLTFENPSIYRSELSKNNCIKKSTKPFNLLFVGRLKPKKDLIFSLNSL